VVHGGSGCVQGDVEERLLWCHGVRPVQVTCTSALEKCASMVDIVDVAVELR
jgi:hypothetical protein